MTIVSRPVAELPAPGPCRFTIATLVNDSALYDGMLVSFAAEGFGATDCEFLHIDNGDTVGLSAYAGLNRLLEEARGQFVILCHQDVRLLGDGRAELEARLADLTRIDATWAIAGNAGGTAPGKLAIRITDGHAPDQHVGTFPERVASLDENFIILRRSARIGPSRDLDGFHFYGADLCLMADIAGYSAYVIDFHLEHLSKGNKSAAFYVGEAAFRSKWSRALRPRWIQTTCSLVYVSGTEIRHRLGGLGQSMAARLSKRMRGARGWTRGSPRPRTQAT